MASTSSSFRVLLGDCVRDTAQQYILDWRGWCTLMMRMNPKLVSKQHSRSPGARIFAIAASFYRDVWRFHEATRLAPARFVWLHALEIAIISEWQCASDTTPPTKATTPTEAARLAEEQSPPRQERATNDVAGTGV